MAFDAGSLLSRLRLDTTGFSTGLSTARSGVNQFDSSVVRSDRTLQGMSGTAAGLGKLMLTGLGFFVATKAVLGFAGAVGDSITMAADLEKSMANVATLVDTSVVSIDELTESVLEMTSEVLKSSEDLSAGLYQVFSAGVTDSAEAMEVLRVSAIAATAGLSTTLTSVDAITTILNAYGLEAERATDVSDLLFQTVKLGKTTFTELANAVGTVISPAAAVGVKLEELFAVLATLTKGGIDTRTATTALRATLLSVLKPSDEAKKKAKQLGIEWNAQALEAKGLIAFLGELREKTQGNAEDITTIVPNVRALNAVLATVGQQWESLIDIQDQFSERAGATQVAFGKQADSFRAKTIRMSLATDRLQTSFGQLTLPIITPVIEQLTKSFEGWLNIVEKFDLEHATNQLTSLGEEVKLLEGLALPQFGLSSDEISKVNVKLAKTRQEYSMMANRVILLANVLDNSKASQDAVNESMKQAEKQVRGIILATNTLFEGAGEFTFVSKDSAENIDSVFTKTEGIKNVKEENISLDEKQLELIDELISKSEELGKTELEIFDMTIAAAADKLGELLASDQKLTDKQREGLEAIFALRKDLRNKEELAEEVKAQREIDRDKRVTDAKLRSIEAFNRQFENAGLTQLQIVERNEQRAIAKATEMGQQTAQITKFFEEKKAQITKSSEEKKTQIKARENAKQLQAASTIATATGNLSSNLNQLLINQGREGSRELFLITQVAAIANAIVSTAVGITRALELGIPLGPPAAALVAAAGAAQIGVIASTALADGGLVERPINALVGEAGPEAIIPIERGVAPIIERSVKSVTEEGGGEKTPISIFNVLDPQLIDARVAQALASQQPQIVLNTINNQTIRGGL